MTASVMTSPATAGVSVQRETATQHAVTTAMNAPPIVATVDSRRSGRPVPRTSWTTNEAMVLQATTTASGSKSVQAPLWPSSSGGHSSMSSTAAPPATARVTLSERRAGAPICRGQPQAMTRITTAAARAAGTGPSNAAPPRTRAATAALRAMDKRITCPILPGAHRLGPGRATAGRTSRATVLLP